MLIGKKIQYGSFPKRTKEVAQTYLWKHEAGGQTEAQKSPESEMWYLPS